MPTWGRGWLECQRAGRPLAGGGDVELGEVSGGAGVG
jgi:hypothetical protein